VNYLEARRSVSAFQGGPPLPFLFGLSGTAEPFALYLQAAAAQRGRSADVRFLPFNTLGQALRGVADATVPEVFLLLPWDFAPEADWRSGVPASLDEEALRLRAAETARLLSRRARARLLYLPAPVPPLFPNPARGAAFAHWIESLAIGLGAGLLPADAFGLGGYLSSGCPVGGSSIGRVAEAVVEAALAPPREPKKVLITDLDNVVWHGLVADDGLDGIACEPAGRGYRHFVYQSLLRRLRHDGTLLAAVSRNDADIATAPFRSGRTLLREEDFVAIIASYHAKSAQIRELARRLNLGMDAFVFVDDNPVELAEVSLQLPEVRCVAFPPHDDELAGFLDGLADLFARLEVTAEDRERTELYRRRLEGMVPSEIEGADLTRFLQDLKMTLTIHDRSHGDRSRAVQLINKTNQFNLNGLRLTDAEVGAMVDAGGRLFGASLADRTGDHGEILACLVAPDGTIHSFVMSCRVFQRRVECAFLAWLATQPNPPTRLQWISTPRNGPFQRFLSEVTGPLNGAGLVRLDPAAVAARHATDLALFAVSSEPNGAR
jgi:FkbH-like protein